MNLKTIFRLIKFSAHLHDCLRVFARRIFSTLALHVNPPCTVHTVHIRPAGAAISLMQQLRAGGRAGGRACDPAANGGLHFIMSSFSRHSMPFHTLQLSGLGEKTNNSKRCWKKNSQRACVQKYLESSLTCSVWGSVRRKHQPGIEEECKMQQLLRSHRCGHRHGVQSVLSCKHTTH